MRLNSIALLGSLVAPSQMPVNASVGRTWEAAVDVFVSRSIPIERMERASGFMATYQVGVARDQASYLAKDCGRRGILPLEADRVSYKVFVQGDSATSTLRVTARWTQGRVPDDPPVMECSTTGLRERELEAVIAVGAETMVPRDATPVNASVGRTWEAAVDVFVSRRIPIHTMESASGFIATDELGVGRQQARQWAECGKFLGTNDADRAIYNVFVRGDSVASTVKVTVRWRHGESELFQCNTKNVRESELETAIRLSAETVVPRDATSISASTDRTWDAVVDLFESRGIPIRTMERASGFLALDEKNVDREQARLWAEICGRNGLFPIDADRAGYNVLVRGDSAASTVKVTVRWTRGGVPDEPRLMECGSKNVLESELEAAIKVSAEAH